MCSKTGFKKLPRIKRAVESRGGSMLRPNIKFTFLNFKIYLVGLTVLFTKISLMIKTQSSCIEKIVSCISVPRLWSLITKKQDKG